MQGVYPIADKLWQCINAATASIDMQRHMGSSFMMLLVLLYQEMQERFRPVSMPFLWPEMLNR